MLRRSVWPPDTSGLQAPCSSGGNSTFHIPQLDDLRGEMRGFPDRDSIGKPSDPAAAAAAAVKPIKGLGVTRRLAGASVIYEIGPGPAALHGGG